MRTDHPENPPTSRARRRTNRNPLWVWIFLWSMTLLACAGFIFKLIEFTLAWSRSGSASFAIVPVISYLAVAAGFACIFIWSFNRGEYRDVERAKYRMLELQDEIDAKGGRV